MMNVVILFIFFNLQFTIFGLRLKVIRHTSEIYLLPPECPPLLWDELDELLRDELDELL